MRLQQIGIFKVKKAMLLLIHGHTKVHFSVLLIMLAILCSTRVML